MQNVNLGIVSPVPQGEWSATVTYQKLSIVRYGNACYIARSQSTGVAPGVDSAWQTYWMALNFDGETGPTGPTGATGEGVPSGGAEGAVLVKDSDSSYDANWVPQSEISAGSAEKDGQGNVITKTYETKQNAQQTYETKEDATSKNSNLQNQITQNQNSIGANSAAISAVENNVLENSDLIARNSKRIDGLEQRITPSPFVTDSTVSYQKDIPSNAVGAAEIQIIGTMTYKTTNLIKSPYVDSSKTENGITWTVNTDGSVTATGTATGASTFVLCNSISFGTTDVNALSANAVSGNYAFSNCSYNGSNQSVYLFVGIGETVSKTYYPIINVGSSSAPYQPYFDGLKDAQVTNVKSIGANLIDYSNSASTTTVQGVTYTVNSDGSVTVTGTNNGEDPALFVVPISTLEDGKTYYISGGNSEVNCRLSTVNGDGFTDSSFVYTRSLGNAQLQISVSAGATVNTTVYPMLNKGSTPLTCAPSQSYSLQIPVAVRPAHGINESVYDSISWSPNGTTVTKRVACGVVDMGTLDWSYGNTFGTGAMCFTSNSITDAVLVGAYAKPNALCAPYQAVTADSIAGGRADKGFTLFSGVSKGFIVADSSYTDVNSFKTAMTGVMLYYELKTPIVTNISGLITSDNLLSIQENGTLIFENENDFAVPSTVEYITSEPNV